MGKTEARLRKALALKERGTPPGEVYRETGIVVMENGSLQDAASGQIIWRDEDGKNGRAVQNSVAVPGGETPGTGGEETQIPLKKQHAGDTIGAKNRQEGIANGRTS